ncbi:MAG: hypothetical protein IJQ71_07270 [Clostridia bacterium]|nr:hypothetical protein [Clostridia bacterium]
MKKGLRCNETWYVDGINRDRIRYEFVTEDGVTPSSCMIRLGDTDPRTGEKITDLTFFREYHKLVDHQVMKNNDAMRPGYTSAEKARRMQRKEAIIATFAAEHGYAPSTSDVLWWLEEEEPERYNLPLDCLVDEEDGSDDLNRHAAFSIPFEEEEESAGLQALREVAAELTRRKAEVYEAMIQRAAGGQVRVRFSEIARKWGVSPKQINKDQEKIKEMVRKRARELMEE